MQEKLAKAWQLFDSGELAKAESLYLDCFRQAHSNNHREYITVLMGLIYVESALTRYDEARKYAEVLLGAAYTDEERRIAVHQCGMVERMAGNYYEAKKLFQQEVELIHKAFSDDNLRLAANFYEQAYIDLKTGNVDSAEEIMNLSLEFAKAAKDDICIGCACRGMGEIMKMRSNNEQALQWFLKAIEAFLDAGDLIAVEEVKALAEIQ